MAEGSLFDGSPDEDDALLISVYQRAGRTLDDLPYTEEFERIYVAACPIDERNRPTMDRATLFRRLHNLRKSGRLPRLGRAPAAPPRIDEAHQSMLVEVVESELGKLSLRDRLPYTDSFDRIVEAWNGRAGLDLPPHDVWRLIAKLAK